MITPADFLKRELAKKFSQNQINELDSLFQVANQIHREQITLAHTEGQTIFDNRPYIEWNMEQSESYYNETYVPNND